MKNINLAIVYIYPVFELFTLTCYSNENILL